MSWQSCHRIGLPDSSGTGDTSRCSAWRTTGSMSWGCRPPRVPSSRRKTTSAGWWTPSGYSRPFCESSAVAPGGCCPSPSRLQRSINLSQKLYLFAFSSPRYSCKMRDFFPICSNSKGSFNSPELREGCACNHTSMGLGLPQRSDHFHEEWFLSRERDANRPGEQARNGNGPGPGPTASWLSSRNQSRVDLIRRRLWDPVLTKMGFGPTKDRLNLGQPNWALGFVMWQTH